MPNTTAKKLLGLSFSRRRKRNYSGVLIACVVLFGINIYMYMVGLSLAVNIGDYSRQTNLLSKQRDALWGIQNELWAWRYAEEEARAEVFRHVKIFEYRFEQYVYGQENMDIQALDTLRKQYLAIYTKSWMPFKKELSRYESGSDLSFQQIDAFILEMRRIGPNLINLLFRLEQQGDAAMLSQIRREETIHTILLVVGVGEVLAFFIWVYIALIQRDKRLLEQDEDLEMSFLHTKDLNKNLYQVNHTLNRELAFREEMLSFASHDIRSPLVAIQSILPLLKVENDEKERDVMFNMVEDSIVHGLDLLNQLILSARMGSTEVNSEKRVLTFAPLVQEVASMYKVQLARKEQTLELDIDDNLQVEGNYTQLKSAIDNYLSNANKYSPKASHIILRVFAQKNKLRLEIQDEGQGLNEDDKAKAFGRFQRLSTTPTGGEHSVGLGLSITKQIIEFHQGSVGVESEKGKGACFFFELPLYNPPKHEIHKAAVSTLFM